jgi:GMP synthase (glutamine-hydrolysing)
MTPQIIVLNAGGQYCHLIARRIRGLGVSAEIRDLETPVDEVGGAKGIIISGGPSSVYEEDSPKPDPKIFELGIPVLGICYGHQLIAQYLGAKVNRGRVREYGVAELRVRRAKGIFAGVDNIEKVWMSHADTVIEPPPGFEVIGETDDCAVAAVANPQKRLYGVQFHPEVAHTNCGGRILKNFISTECHCELDWDPSAAVDRVIQEIRTKVLDKNVFFLISGGVDSTVAFKLCVNALGKEKVIGLYVDTGFMRKNESKDMEGIFRRLGLDNIRFVDEIQKFYDALERVYDPEEKRVKIGELFYRIQEDMLRDLRNAGAEWILGQGTIYPDTIETGHSRKAAKIKTHHNRVDLMKNLLDAHNLLEPLSEFYKDEVREVGSKLGLPDEIIWKHPFPGPGLAIRCLCSPSWREVNEDESLTAVVSQYGMRAKRAGLRTVGVQGDSRTYANLALVGGEAALSTLEEVSTQITNAVDSINRVAYIVAPRVDNRDSWHIQPGFLTQERVDLLREADSIVQQFMRSHPAISRSIWQFPVILAPITRGRGESVVLRPVSSKDGMTAEFTKIPLELLQALSRELLQRQGVDCVLYDITNKPPGTIEWE